MRRRLAFATAAALLPLLAAAGLADTVLSQANRAGLALTITQDDTALVRDRRTASLEKGAQTLVVEGVARQAREATAMLSAPGITVTEQNFDLAGLDADRLLAASLNREVTVIWRDAGGTEREERAKIVAAGPQPVFQVAGKLVAGTPVRILYDALPPDMRTVPAFRANLTADAAGKRDLELAYLTGGLSWQADYVAELSPTEDKLALSAWATLSNASGTDYPQAKIQIMAGDLNRVADQPEPWRKEKMMMAAAGPTAPAREALGGYHLYTLPMPVSLKDGERKQVAFMPPANVAAERALVLDPLPPHAWRDRLADPPPQNPLAVLRLKNSTGEPLPAGIVRVFQRAKDGGATFLGEDQLTATPSGGHARLSLGRAFDLTARRTQTDFVRVSAEVTEAAWEVKLANAGERPAKVLVRESFGGDWLVVDENAKHDKDTAFTAAWSVTVPAKGEAVLKYRARVKG
ncbi:MAG: DUF4139 domain-containing protein [Rhodospirillaceae bacterium]|nr:DUF4139 domain-containing protein [Rhodospirillales bacterium]